MEERRKSIEMEKKEGEIDGRGAEDRGREGERDGTWEEEQKDGARRIELIQKELRGRI